MSNKQAAQRNYLEENLHWLRVNLPGVYRQTVAPSAVVKSTLEEFETETGWNSRISLSTGACFWLHSLYDREREYRLLTNDVQQEHVTAVIFGCGNGDFIDWLAQRHNHLRHIIVVEPDPAVFQSFLKRCPIRNVLGAFSKVSLIINQPGVNAGDLIKQAFMGATLTEKAVVLLGLVNYRWHYREYYQGLQTSLLETLRNSKVSYNTMNAFRDLWLVNNWQNMLQGDADAGDFQDSFCGKPAIIVSAGPSLDKNIHLLKQASNKALIIAVGSSISILRKHGIKPHFYMAIDPGEGNDALFSSVYEDTVPLLYSGHLFYKVLSAYSGAKIHMSLGYSVWEHELYRRAQIDRFDVSSGFSVANVAANLLSSWRCSPIIFVGQDLAYTEERLHAAGSWDKEFEGQYIRRDLVRKDIFGNDVYTDSAFEGMRQIFERTISLNPELSFINATEGGVAIDGAPNKPLQEVLDALPEAVQSFEQAIQDTLSVLRQEDKMHQQQAALLKEVAHLEDEVTSLYETIKKNMRDLEGILRREQPPDTKEAKKIAKTIKKIENDNLYQTIILPIFREQFRMRREGHLRQETAVEGILPQVRLFYLELAEIRDYLLKAIRMMRFCQGKDETKIIFN